MKAQRESNLVWFIAILSLLLVVALFCFGSDPTADSDATFLYNRCYQLWDTICHGYFPFLYYNDIGGIGYASPVFYGQLTLLPFIPFLGGIQSFINAYHLVRVLLNFFGFRCFIKRLSEHATLSACFYILGIPFVLMCGAGLHAFVLGVGICWFFFAYCIDFFRDGVRMWHLVLSYFLIWETNFNAVVFATVICFVLFVRYFRRDRWRGYVRLFLVVLLLISYNLVNMAVHIDALRLVDISQWLSGDTSTERIMLSSLPFGGFLFRGVANSWGIGDLCCGFMQFGVLFVFVRSLWLRWAETSSSYRVCACVILSACALGYVFGLHFIWGFVWNMTHAFFQFPIRYFIFLYGFVIALLSRVVRPGRLEVAVLLICAVDLFFANPMQAGISRGDMPIVFYYTAYGEYLGGSFVDGDDTYSEYVNRVHSESGVSYPFVNEYNGLSVDCSGNTGDDYLLLPKLYYRGYKAYGSGGEVFPVSSGYSNYCQVAIVDYNGSLRLIYEVPAICMAFFWLQVACLLGVFHNLIPWDGVERRRRT